MNYIIKEVSVDYIKEHLPYLFYADTRYFALLKNKKYVGIYSITDYGNNIGEASLTIFDQFRFKVFNKDFLSTLFNHHLTIGYKEIWAWLECKGWKKVFERFKNFGIKEQLFPPFWDCSPNKIWFNKKGS